MTLTLQEKISRDFGRVAHNYDNYALLQRQVAEKLFYEFTIVPGVMLDIGCGTGYFHELLRKNKIYLPLVQTDIASEMCQIASGYASPPEYGATHTCVADMHHLPFANETFSGIFSSMTMQWSHDPVKVFSEIARLLAPNGTFACSLVSQGSLAELYQAFVLAGYTPPIHEFYSQNELGAALKSAGLTIGKIHAEIITLHYDDVISLLRSIKNVGASYKGSRYSGLRGKNYFSEIEKHYRSNFAGENGMPVSWRVVHIHGYK